jgi:hypothetical protein
MRSRWGSDDVAGAVELEDGTRIEFLNVCLDGLLRAPAGVGGAEKQT